MIAIINEKLCHVWHSKGHVIVLLQINFRIYVVYFKNIMNKAQLS